MNGRFGYRIKVADTLESVQEHLDALRLAMSLQDTDTDEEHRQARTRQEHMASVLRAVEAVLTRHTTGPVPQQAMDGLRAAFLAFCSRYGHRTMADEPPALLRGNGATVGGAA